MCVGIRLVTRLAHDLGLLALYRKRDCLARRVVLRRFGLATLLDV